MAPTEFDQQIQREQTGAVKFDARQAVFGRPDVIPLWVADMDFAAPTAITEALVARAQHPVYGYTLFPDSLYQAMIDWFAQRHHWTIEREWILMAPGVVPSLHAAAVAFTEPGAAVVIQPPVYPPFYAAADKTGRRVVENPLRSVQGRYEFDLDHLKACAEAGAKLLLLCSPHNPVGRVWRPEELDAVLAIARQHDMVVLSDEIHADLVYPDSHAHTMLARRPGAAEVVVTAVAPSKSFNIPGLGLSALVVPSRRHREALRRALDSMHMVHCNPFSATAFEAGYRHGGPWLDQLLSYLQGNRDWACQYLAERLPQLGAETPEGTYLLWLDCRRLGLTDAELKRFFVHQASIGLNPGLSFGAAGSGFMRLNLGAPRGVLEAALSNLAEAVAQLPQ
ncbi:MalY/PatB family protein [Marinobacter sp. SS21]|uniref:MalY/PatB family protein n=1 Tax=Marinobacter sp. SS21 TaxID=2979460 RepID=UPI002330D869|nr:PatB family C-S lyase [Marinobacter sp. SS21]MDC0662819.1 PatB family C-S lyase [Marinobacter sp. SS21]